MNPETAQAKEVVIDQLDDILLRVVDLRYQVQASTYCDTVLNQIANIQVSLRRTGKSILNNHIQTQFAKRVLEDGDEAAKDLLLSLETVRRLKT